MFPFVELVEGEPRHFYGCSKCSHYECENLNDESDPLVAESLERLRRDAEEKFASLGEKNIATLAARIRLISRIQYGAAFLLLVTGVVLISITGYPWHLLNTTALAALIFFQGMRSSYRYWQLVNRTLYQPGAFRAWLRSGQWLI